MKRTTTGSRSGRENGEGSQQASAQGVALPSPTAQLGGEVPASLSPPQRPAGPWTVGPPDGPAERIAARVAEHVARDGTVTLPEPVPQLATAPGRGVSRALGEAIDAARGGGRPLASDLQRRMEGILQVPLTGVQLHTDARADRLSRALHARAFTAGRDVFFERDAFAPGSRGGDALLAHELTHVAHGGDAPVVHRELKQSVKDSLTSILTTWDEAYAILALQTALDYSEAVVFLGNPWFVKMFGKLDDTRKVDEMYARVLLQTPAAIRATALGTLLPADVTKITDPRIWDAVCEALDTANAAALVAAFKVLRPAQLTALTQRGPVSMRFAVNTAESAPDMIDALPNDAVRPLFEARFGIKAVQGTAKAAGLGVDTADVGAAWDHKGLRNTWKVLRTLPQSHAVATPEFTQVARLSQGDANYYSSERHEIALLYAQPATTATASFSDIVYHEVGHAVDAKLKASTGHWAAHGPKWKEYDTAGDALVALFTAAGNLPAFLGTPTKLAHFCQALSVRLAPKQTKEQLKTAVLQARAQAVGSWEGTEEAPGIKNFAANKVAQMTAQLDERNFEWLSTQLGAPAATLQSESREQMLARIRVRAEPQDEQTQQAKYLATEVSDDDVRGFAEHAAIKAVVAGMGASPWVEANKPPAVGGRIFHESYNESHKWISYEAAARAKKVSDYQFRAPGEWFAEAYTAFYAKNPHDVQPLETSDAEAFRWFDETLEEPRAAAESAKALQDRRTAAAERRN